MKKDNFQDNKLNLIIRYKLEYEKFEYGLKLFT